MCTLYINKENLSTIHPNTPLYIHTHLRQVLAHVPLERLYEHALSGDLSLDLTSCIKGI